MGIGAAIGAGIGAAVGVSGAVAGVTAIGGAAIGASLGASVAGSRNAADAARDAANTQAAAGADSIAFQRESLAQSRADLQPFRDAGATQFEPGTSPTGEKILGLDHFVRDSQAQADYVQNNPFFKAMADDAQRRLFNNQAARGKVGSGETAKALQNSLLLLGSDLVDRTVTQRTNLATLGANAAAGQATATQNTASSVGSTIEGIGNAQAAGQVGAANAQVAGTNSLISGGLGAANLLKLSDERAKEDIEMVGELFNGLPVYTFKYKGSDIVHMGVMAQELEKVNPEAVHEIDGVKYVDYGEIKCH